MSAAFDWIFFDCFNTLIDDFDTAGDESGLGSLPDRAVTAGFVPQREDFIRLYRQSRAPADDAEREVLFDERLRRTLAAAKPASNPAERATAVTALLAHWESEYLASLRPTPGAAAVLAHWAPRKPLGVVSNFFLPHYPARYFAHFGFGRHFRFVLDSAACGFKKPHRPIFQAAMALAGLATEEARRVLFIGDRLDLDVLPARDFGMQVIHFNRRKTRPTAAPTPPGITAIHDWDDFR